MREWQAVDKHTFHDEVCEQNEPAVLRRQVADWPLVRMGKESTESVAEYLRGFGPDEPVKAFFADPDTGGRYFYSDDFRGFNFQRRELPFAELLDTLLQCIADDNPPGIYAGAIPLRGPLQSLLGENRLELLDDSVDKLESIWIGNRGRTTTHWDLPQNLACVVHGRRRFTLFPPTELPNLYVGPLDNTLAGQPVSLVDPLQPDLERFPRFAQATQEARVAELEPGDALYLPSMWFHHVEALDPFGVLVNFWWRDAAPYMLSPNFTLLHALLTIRDMPQHERDVWRQVFDYYIFSHDDDTLRHIPEDALGVLGDITPETAAKLRMILVRSLGGEPRRE